MGRLGLTMEQMLTSNGFFPARKCLRSKRKLKSWEVKNSKKVDDLPTRSPRKKTTQHNSYQVVYNIICLCNTTYCFTCFNHASHFWSKTTRNMIRLEVSRLNGPEDVANTIFGAPVPESESSAVRELVRWGGRCGGAFDGWDSVGSRPLVVGGQSLS